VALLNRRDTAADRDYLDFPIGDETYRVWEVSASVAVTVMKLADIGRDVHEGRDADTSELSDGEERDLYARLLGETWDQLIDDDLPWSDVQAVCASVMAWVVRDKDTAEQVWNSGGKPPGEATPTPGNRASRRASKGSATTTKKPASGTRTKVSKSKTPARPGRKSLACGASSRPTCTANTA